MIPRSLRRANGHRVFICLLLFAGLLVLDVGVRSAASQSSDLRSEEASPRHGWVSGGIGTGTNGLGASITGGAPIGEHVFVGGRYTHSEELYLLRTDPPSIWDAGPLVGLVDEGRWGHISVATGLTVVGGRLPDNRGVRASTLAVPFDLQVFFTPIRSVGIGVHGYTNVNTGDNVAGWSLQLQIRMPQ